MFDITQNALYQKFFARKQERVKRKEILRCELERAKKAMDKFMDTKRTMLEWEVIEMQERRQRLETITEARQLIAAAKAKFDFARDSGKDVTGWSAERTLIWLPEFRTLCKALNDGITWRMFRQLSREDRAFWSDAVTIARKK